MFYVWLCIAIFLAIIEMSTVSLVSIWFVASSLLAMIISIFIDSIVVQSIIFVIGGVILMLLTRKFTTKLMPKKEKTNIDRIIGMKGIVTEKITKKVPGAVKVDGKVWSAFAEETIPVDSEVEVLEINSTKIKVKRLEE